MYNSMIRCELDTQFTCRRIILYPDMPEVLNNINTDIKSFNIFWRLKSTRNQGMMMHFESFSTGGLLCHDGLLTVFSDSFPITSLVINISLFVHLFICPPKKKIVCHFFSEKNRRQENVWGVIRIRHIPPPPQPSDVKFVSKNIISARLLF